ncbi:hypothetical protein CYMTET_22290 [Cymbomonas tetramitiformis]|uniref:Pseudouridine synthase RsuA/RluA-like domain-containing protein n=1 Tax=Cymbomonas tetramitiformis TaxID=36881 RepID=A0AAE0G0J0_9CHLO|nr:hypothetical protein CYMTET_22290 [Cymbomonas tetramitiformis]
MAACDRIVEPGETVHVVQRVCGESLGVAQADPNPEPLQVVYEDACMAGVVKPQGLPMHGDVSDPSFLSGLPHVLQPARVLGALPWPQHVHRLDLPTGGLVLVAKTHAVQVALGALFASRDIKKQYRAVVHGHLEGCGTVMRAVDGKEAITDYQAQAHSHSASFGNFTVVKLHPRTGRTHQLRRHMADLGHPIVNDSTYGRQSLWMQTLPLVHGMCLWAERIQFPHPDLEMVRNGPHMHPCVVPGLDLASGIVTIQSSPPSQFRTCPRLWDFSELTKEEED